MVQVNNFSRLIIDLCLQVTASTTDTHSHLVVTTDRPSKQLAETQKRRILSYIIIMSKV